MPDISHLFTKRKELQTQHSLLSEKVERLRTDWAIQAGTAVRYQLEKEIEQAEADRNDIEQQIEAVDDQLRKGYADYTYYFCRNPLSTKT